MMDPVLIPIYSSVAGAIVAGIFSIIVAIINKQLQPKSTPPIIDGPITLVDHRGNPIRRSHALPRKPRLQRFPKVTELTAIILIPLGSLIGYAYGSNIRNAPFDIPASTATLTNVSGTDTATATLLPSSTPGSTPTPIAKGPLLMEINFASTGEGNCNNYDSNLLGYENRQYYIQPPSYGYLAICHNGSWVSQGSLQVTAYPTGDLTSFGYGILFGWAGGGLATTDGCFFGIRRGVRNVERGGLAPNVETVTEVIFMESIDGVQTTDFRLVSPIALDNNLHILRMTLEPNGLMTGYLDERFIATHRFNACKDGPIGLVAWGTGETRVYFDDVKLFDLP